MRWKNTERQYGAVAKFFHWATVLLVLHQFITAFIMETGIISVSMDFYTWHKLMGGLTLGVITLRLAWRLITPLPHWAVGLFGWEISIIRTIERLVYLAVFVTAISGLVMSIAGGRDLKVFGWFTLPATTERIDWLVALGRLVHMVAGYALVMIVSVHLAFVIRRHLYEKGHYIRRMLPFTTDTPERPDDHRTS